MVGFEGGHTPNAYWKYKLDRLMHPIISKVTTISFILDGHNLSVRDHEVLVPEHLKIPKYIGLVVKFIGVYSNGLITWHFRFVILRFYFFIPLRVFLR